MLIFKFLSKLTFLFLAGQILYSFPLGYSEEGTTSQIEVTADIDHGSVTIGDPVIYRVNIRYSDDITLLSSIPAPDPGFLKVKEIEEITADEGTPRLRGREFKLVSFRLGQFVLEPITIEYRIGDGPIQHLESNRIYLSVTSVAQGETKQDIRGTKSTLSFPHSNRNRALLVGLLGLVMVLIISRILQKKKGAVPAQESPSLSLDQEALVALSQLQGSDFIRKGEYKAYYLTLSEILKKYFEGRYQFLACEMTTHEIISQLKRSGTLLDLREKINKVLIASDLAKFAKWKPGPDEVITLHRQSKEIIHESTPSPDAS